MYNTKYFIFLLSVNYIDYWMNIVYWILIFYFKTRQIKTDRLN